MFNRYENYLVHDEKEACITGDVVRIEAGVRTSRHKKHVVNEIITPFGRPLSEVPASSTSPSTASSVASTSTSTSTNTNTNNTDSSAISSDTTTTTTTTGEEPVVKRKKNKIILNEAMARRLLVETPKNRALRISAERAEKLLDRIQKKPNWFREKYPDVKIAQFENKRTQNGGKKLKGELLELIRNKTIL